MPEDSKDCFASLEKVFPMGPDGLREIADECWECDLRIGCLKQAMQSDPAAEAVREQSARRSDPEGVAGVLRRWSRRKTAANKKAGK